MNIYPYLYMIMYQYIYISQYINIYLYREQMLAREQLQLQRLYAHSTGNAPSPRPGMPVPPRTGPQPPGPGVGGRFGPGQGPQGPVARSPGTFIYIYMYLDAFSYQHMVHGFRNPHVVFYLSKTLSSHKHYYRPIRQCRTLRFSVR